MFVRCGSYTALTVTFWIRRAWSGFALLAVLAAAAPAALADDTAPDSREYFFSMRAPSVDPAPRYVAASRDPVEGKTASVAGCDGATYYLSPADAAAVRAAMANENTVQLQAGEMGQGAQESRVACLMQASQ